MNYTCRCTTSWLSKNDYDFGCTCNQPSRSTKTSKPKDRNSQQLATAKLALKGASGKLVHATPKLIRQPSLIERTYSRVSLKSMVVGMGLMAGVSWVIGG